MIKKSFQGLNKALYVSNTTSYYKALPPSRDAPVVVGDHLVLVGLLVCCTPPRRPPLE